MVVGPALELGRVLEHDDALAGGYCSLISRRTALQSVVLPEPVPPQTRTFSWSRTAARIASHWAAVIVPCST